VEKGTKTNIFFICSAGLLILFIRLFVIDFAAVRGRSMEPGLHEGDFLVIYRAAYGLILPFANIYIVRWGAPAMGEVVLCRNPEDGEPTVKRCAGTAGDEIFVKEGFLTVSGRRVPLKFYQEHLFPEREIVPDGFVFVLGDNPEVSVDSRNFGFLPTGAILGRALFPNPALEN